MTTLEDLHRAAAMLYEELKRKPWFSAVVTDEPGRKLIVECRDVAKGGEYFPVEVKDGQAQMMYRDCPVEVVNWKGQAYRPSEIEDEGEGMIS